MTETTNILGDRHRQIRSPREVAEEFNRQVAEENRREALERKKKELEEKRNPKKEQIPEVQEPSTSKVITLDNYLRLENISCTDADGNVFEHYPVIYARKDIYRKGDNSPQFFTPYDAVKHAAANGDFHPSFALSCNILASLYSQRDNPEIDAVLKQYLDKGNGTGYHGQNTIIDWGNQKIIHYPQDSDFKSSGGTDKINSGHKKTVLGFDQTGFSDTTLESALTIPNYRAYVQNLTGLRDPVILCQIGTYFDKPARVWVSSQNEMRASWLGCLNGLDLVSYYGLYNNGAVRGVRKI
jgi:hypothetical protein